MRRRKKLHPLLQQIAKRQREIAKLIAAARMIGLDVEPVLKRPYNKFERDPKKAAEYHRQMAEAMQAPDLPEPVRQELSRVNRTLTSALFGTE